jgi:hypothetical protein
MTVTIPLSIADVDAQWLSESTGFDVESATFDQIGVGIGVSSAVYRASLIGSDCPSSVIVKLPALDEGAAFTSTVLRMYIREVRFFNTLAKDCPFRVPVSYYGDVNEETSQFAMVIEDLGALRIVDQNIGMDIDDAVIAVDGLAHMHALWWGKGDALAQDGTTVSLGDPIYPAILPMVFAEGLEKVTKEMKLPKSILDIGPKFGANVGQLLASLMTGPNTLAHGDFRADNMLFTAANELAVIDFQLIGSGTGAYDLAYFVTQSLATDVASAHEIELFDHWLDGLRRHGAPAELIDRNQLWEHYRAAALFCLVYPIVASRGMDLNDPRQYALVESMNERFDRALTELNLAELI